MDDQELEAWVTASRAAQGLPPKVEDPSVLAKVVNLLLDEDHLVESP